MCIKLLGISLLSTLGFALWGVRRAASLAELTLEAGQVRRVAFVGAVSRWDADGNPRKPVSPRPRSTHPG